MVRRNAFGMYYKNGPSYKLLGAKNGLEMTDLRILLMFCDTSFRKVCERTNHEMSQWFCKHIRYKDPYKHGYQLSSVMEGRSWWLFFPMSRKPLKNTSEPVWCWTRQKQTWYSPPKKGQKSIQSNMFWDFEKLLKHIFWGTWLIQTVFHLTEVSTVVLVLHVFPKRDVSFFPRKAIVTFEELGVPSLHDFVLLFTIGLLSKGGYISRDDPSNANDWVSVRTYW